MTAELITAWATSVMAVAAIVTLYKQTESFKLSISADLSVRLDQRFQSKQFREIRVIAARALRDGGNTTDAEDVLDFFETIGLFVRRKVLDPEFVYSQFYHWIVLYWAAGRYHIRAYQKEYPEAWKDFERLYTTMMKFETSELTKEEIYKDLTEEIQLCD